jgi:Flp pilus assembly pilin Flp
MMSVPSEERGRTGLASGDQVCAECPAPARDKGASAIEYALLIALIALVIFTAMALLGINVSELYSSIATGY